MHKQTCFENMVGLSVWYPLFLSGCFKNTKRKTDKPCCSSFFAGVAGSLRKRRALHVWMLVSSITGFSTGALEEQFLVHGEGKRAKAAEC